MDGLGQALIAICLRDRSFGDATRMGLEEPMLLEESAAAWRYCMELLRAKAFPSLEELRVKFGVEPEVPEGDTVESLVRRIRKRAYIIELKPLFRSATRWIEEGEPEKAAEEILRAGSLRARFSKKTSGPLSYRDSYVERILQYRLRKESGGVLGAATRWPTLNRTIQGLQNGLFHVIAAMTSVGKSWFLMIIVADLLLQGRRPLVVSTEMHPMRLQARLDCLRYKLPFPMMRDGKLTSELEDEWMKQMWEEATSGVSDAIFLGKNEIKNVQDVQMYAVDLGVTDVLVDGGYRLAASREWADQQRTIEDSQIAAEATNIPWTYTVQLGDSSETGSSFGKKLLKKWSTRYAKEWEIDPDVVLFLSQPPDLKVLKQMNVQVAKWRDGDGKPVDFPINWNPDEMNYDEVDTAEELASVVETLAEMAK